MAISSEYRLPGVYSTEVQGPRLNVTSGGNSTIAFVGPALGYRTASQQVVFSGVEKTELANGGVIADSYSVKSRSGGNSYTLNQDFVAEQDVEGKTFVSRKLTTLSTEYQSVSGELITFYSAQPSFSLQTKAGGADTNGYVIKGTLEIKNEDCSVTYVEGTDYSVNYHTNVVSAKTGGAFENAQNLNISYKWTTAEPIELVGEAAFGLEHKYISENGLTDSEGNPYSCRIVSCKYDTNEFGDTPGSTDGYIEGVDFEIDYTTSRIARTATSRIPTFNDDDGNFFYAEFAYCAIKSGETATVTYRYSDSDYGVCKYYESYNDLANVLGNPWDVTTGEIQSPISAAAYMASRNGMGGCYAVPVEGTSNGSDVTYTQVAWENAIDALSVIEGIDIIVPVTGDFSVWQYVATHCATMKEEEDERVAIIGADGVSAAITSATMIDYAEKLASTDMWLVSPATFKMLNPVTAIVEAIPGYYAAAAVAGLESTMRQYVPLTNKSVSGLYSANEYNTKTVKKNQSANGLMYIDETTSGMRIVHGRTTSNESIVDRETNIVLTKYYIIKSIRNLFSNGYIGSIITPLTLANMQASLVVRLGELVDSNFIYSYTGVEIAQDTSNPTQVNVSFEYVPVYGMNYIQVTFSIDGTTTI